MKQRFFHRYHKKDDYNNYDHIIIGSGIGGLTTAACLASQGHKVLVLEQHHQAGGFSHTFKRKKGYQWDVGVHYIGNVGKREKIKGIFNFIPNSNRLKVIFDFLSDNELKWETLGEVYDVIQIGEDRYEFVAGKKEQIEQLKKYFPKEAEVIDKYFDLISLSNQRSETFFLEKTFPAFLSNTIGKVIRKKFNLLSDRTTYEVLSELTENKRLIAVLCAQCGDYGLPPKKSSFAIHAMVVAHFLHGGYYPQGGAGNIVHTISKKIESLGGKVVVKATVDEIVVKNNSVEGVRIEDRFIPCKSVISTVGANNTYNYLLKRELGFSQNKIEASTGHMCLYLGLNKSDEELGLPKYNIWDYAHEDIDGVLDIKNVKDAAENFAYLSFPSAKDAAWQNEHPNKAVIQALSLGKYDWFKKYEGQKVMKREEAYNQQKELFEKTMIDKLCKHYPQIRNHIEVTEVSTPLSTKHYVNYQEGEIYGLAHNPQRFKHDFLRFGTKIKGLKMAGQDIITAGVAGALMSGLLCSMTILKFKTLKLFKDIARFQ